jgi:glutathione S-transferase
MSNLLPPEGKKTVKTEYWVRTASVWAILWSLVFGAIVLMLGSTYMLLSSRLETVRAETAQKANDATTSFQEAKNAILRANTFATKLAKTSSLPATSRVLSELDHELSSEIALTAVALAPNDKTLELEVRGVAKTREALAQFVERLKRNPYFADARVPVSDLARATDAPFGITVIISDK